ncbi:MAG: DUF981 domain-containing protein [Thermoplasmatales archaeon]|nr:DUF981 domain-containing protein [Thermoplasmatales archaeon]
MPWRLPGSYNIIFYDP